MSGTYTLSRSGSYRGRVAAAMVAALLLLPVAAAPAARLVLRIRAGNPIDKPQEVEIRSNLPQRVETNHIISLAGLDLGYDVANDVYFVHKTLELAPREIQVFDVEIEDIWSIPEDSIDVLRRQAARLSEKLEGTRYAETGTALESQVADSIDRIRTAQRANAIGAGVEPMQHIRAFEENMQRLTQVRKDVGRLENLVLGTGQDPGMLVGQPEDAPKPTKSLSLEPDAYKTAVIRITVENTSATHRRRFTLRRDLPPEVLVQDVLDAGELQVGRDVEKGVSYVFKRDLELEPGETLTFDVRIRDKWNINEPRIAALRDKTASLIEHVEAKRAPEAVQAGLRDIQSALEGLAAAEGPETLGQEYVAFYRQQTDTLDDLEERLERIRETIQPLEITSRIGWDVKPPSSKTTWLLIYVILGFLAVLSILFFLRWYRQTAD